MRVRSSLNNRILMFIFRTCCNVESPVSQGSPEQRWAQRGEEGATPFVVVAWSVPSSGRWFWRGRAVPWPHRWRSASEIPSAPLQPPTLYVGDGGPRAARGQQGGRGPCARDQRCPQRQQLLDSPSCDCSTSHISSHLRRKICSE